LHGQRQEKQHVLVYNWGLSNRLLIIVISCYDIGETLDENIEDTTVKPGQLKCLDFGMNVNMELSENWFFFHWLHHTKLTLALFTVLLIIFLSFLFYPPKQIPIMTIDMDGSVFIVLLYVASSVSGKIISMISKIPPSVGMILMGMTLKNSRIFTFNEESFSKHWFYLRFVKSNFSKSTIL